jgi:DNA-binding MarR family transcriptional regulator
MILAFKCPGRYLTTFVTCNYIRVMRSVNEHPMSLEGSIYRELRVLEEVDGSADLSQRRLANQLGIALGVANLLVKRLAKKGYIRVTQLGWKRWAYVVTPTGMARKIYLTKAYIERFVDHYQRVRALLREDLSRQHLTADSRVALVGTSELAELAFLALRDIGILDIEVFGSSEGHSTFLGMKVYDYADIAFDRYANIVLVDRPLTDGNRDGLGSLGLSDAKLVEILRVPESVSKNLFANVRDVPSDGVQIGT